jgi:hypothetical protein
LAIGTYDLLNSGFVLQTCSMCAYYSVAPELPDYSLS